MNHAGGPIHHRPVSILNSRLIVLAVLAVASAAPRRCGASPHNPNTDWFSRAGYGIFVHYLCDIQNAATSLHSLGRQTGWDECVRDFDVRRFAEQAARAGAGYVIFTMHQRTRFLIAPNATFDRLTGYRPGEACATRDLVLDLAEALRPHRIPLMLYWTGDGPRQDEKAAAALGWKDPVTTEYVTRWASVVQEYGERYGERVAGWWVDGCYPFIGYDQDKLGILARGLKAGSPRRIIALNPGVQDKVRAYSPHEDYTTGEQNRFLDQPASRWVDGEQWHILSYLGCGLSAGGIGWSMPGVCMGKQEMIEYIAEVNRAGGVVSIDVMLYRDGGLDRSQLELLKALRPGLATAQSSPPVPAGNLAYHKPARLLSLDGSHELEVNGGVHFARLGVDGRTDTTALAGGEWPWAYQVDLREPKTVRRVHVMFAPDGYPTRLRIEVSPDGRTFKPVGSADRPDGSPYTCEFAPTRAQYIRVCGIRPDGPDQPGRQMAVAELQVFE